MSVGPEKTFQSLAIGSATFLHALYVLKIVRQGTADSAKLDKLQGMGYGIIIMLFFNAIFWGTQDLVEEEFRHHGNITQIDPMNAMNTRNFHPNMAILSTFAAQTIFSTFALISEIGVLYAIVFWKDELITSHYNAPLTN